jgi:hypothetical protein
MKIALGLGLAVSVLVNVAAVRRFSQHEPADVRAPEPAAEPCAAEALRGELAALRAEVESLKSRSPQTTEERARPDTLAPLAEQMRQAAPETAREHERFVDFNERLNELYQFRHTHKMADDAYAHRVIETTAVFLELEEPQRSAFHSAALEVRRDVAAAAREYEEARSRFNPSMPVDAWEQHMRAARERQSEALRRARKRLEESLQLARPRHRSFAEQMEWWFQYL